MTKGSDILNNSSEDFNEIMSDNIKVCPHCGSKKYHVHGKVERNKETGKTEISYYECDNIVCKKVFIKNEK